jgi:uncharacterized protein YjbJ (UPF0337 family)
MFFTIVVPDCPGGSASATTATPCQTEWPSWSPEAAAAKETVGKAIGNAKMQNDGKTDTAVDKIQNAVGSLKDAVKKPATPLASF